MPATATVIQVSAPCRADFAGPWLDTDDYFKTSKYGFGKTLNAGIVLQDGRGKDEYVCAIIDRQKGIHKQIHQEDDWGGLGTSASLNVVESALVFSRRLFRNLTNEDRLEVARMAWRVANLGYGLKGGWQDELAACFGGFCVYTLYPDGEIGVERLNVADETILALEKRIILYSTGVSRLSSDIHKHVWGNLNWSIPIMDRMMELVEPTKQAILTGDLDAFGYLLSATCAQLFALHESVADPSIVAAFDILKQEGIFRGGKPGGAGGGGVCLILIEEGAEKRAKQLLNSLSEEGGVLDWRFDLEGLRIGPVVSPTSQQ